MSVIFGLLVTLAFAGLTYYTYRLKQRVVAMDEGLHDAFSYIGDLIGTQIVKTHRLEQLTAPRASGMLPVLGAGFGEDTNLSEEMLIKLLQSANDSQFLVSNNAIDGVQLDDGSLGNTQAWTPDPNWKARDEREGG